jgi:hypothetical protein
MSGQFSDIDQLAAPNAMIHKPGDLPFPTTPLTYEDREVFDVPRVAIGTIGLCGSCRFCVHSWIGVHQTLPLIGKFLFLPASEMERVLVEQVKMKKETDWESLVRSVCEETGELDAQSLIIAAKAQLREGMTDREILRTLAQTAVEQTSVEQPGWQFVAARLLAEELYRAAAHNRGYDRKQGMYGDFYDLQQLTAKGLYGSYLLEHYTEAEIRELEAFIRPERDRLFHYIGLKILADRYLVRDYDGAVMELPQERFMVIAMHLAMKERDRLTWAKQMYDVLSRLEVTVSTPTMSNAGRPLHQLSSCFIDTVDDSLWSIYNTNTAAPRCPNTAAVWASIWEKCGPRGPKFADTKALPTGSFLG